MGRGTLDLRDPPSAVLPSPQLTLATCDGQGSDVVRDLTGNWGGGGRCVYMCAGESPKCRDGKVICGESKVL